MASNAKKIAEGVFYSSASNLILKMFSGLSYFLIISKMSLHDYGVFLLATSFLAPAVAFSFFGFDRIFVSSVAKARGQNNFGRVRGIVKEYFYSVIILSLLFFIISFCAKNLLIRWFDIYIFRYFWLIAFFALSQILLNMSLLFLEGFECFKKISIIGTTESFSRTILIFCLFILNLMSVEKLILAYGVAKIISLFFSIAYLVPVARKVMTGVVITERSVLPGIIKDYGKWEIAKMILTQIIQPIKLWLIKMFVNVQGVAVYDFARKIYSFISNLVPIQKVIFPVVSRYSSQIDRANMIIAKAKKYTLLFSLFLYTMLIITAPTIIAIFFKQYSGYVWAVYLMCLHLFVDVYKLAQDPLLYSFNKQKFVFQMLVPFSVIQIVLDIFLTKTGGVFGTIISWHLYALLVGFFTNVYLRRSTGMKNPGWGYYFSYDEHDKIVLEKITAKIKSYYFRLNPHR